MAEIWERAGIVQALFRMNSYPVEAERTLLLFHQKFCEALYSILVTSDHPHSTNRSNEYPRHLSFHLGPSIAGLSHQYN